MRRRVGSKGDLSAQSSGLQYFITDVDKQKANDSCNKYVAYVFALKRFILFQRSNDNSSVPIESLSQRTVVRVGMPYSIHSVGQSGANQVEAKVIRELGAVLDMLC